jgi:hypothetical protein
MVMDGKSKMMDDLVGAPISLLFYEEDGVSVAYAPSLDLFGYGNSEQEANASFWIVLEEFLRYTIENGTLDAELTRMGWKFDAKGSLLPPKLNHVLKQNRNAADIVNNRDFRKISQKLPAFS